MMLVTVLSGGLLEAVKEEKHTSESALDGFVETPSSPFTAGFAPRDEASVAVLVEG